jgi:hypothetical protein
VVVSRARNGALARSLVVLSLPDRSSSLLLALFVAVSPILPGHQLAASSTAATVAQPVGDTFIEAAELSAAGGTAEDAFGVTVAASGDTVVVGAPGRGAALVFTRPAGDWSGGVTETAMLVASGSTPDDGFGSNVAISGGTVVISADSRAHHSAYVFVEPEDGWSGVLTESAALTKSDGLQLLPIGRGLAVAGDTIVMSGLLFDAERQAFEQGAAYIFVEPDGGWSGTLTESARLTTARPSTDNFFGNAVAIAGDTVVVGAYFDQTDIGRGYGGSAYVFVKPSDGWTGTITETAKLIAWTGQESEYPFGWSVAVDGDTIVVSSDFDMINEYGRGSAYVFRKPVSGWSGTPKADAKLVAAGDKDAERAVDVRLRDVRSFGATLAVAGGTIDAGSWKSAYVFVEPDGGWSGELTETQKLSAPNGTPLAPVDILALADDTLVIGAPNADTGRYGRQGMHVDSETTSQGAAYVFLRGPSSNPAKPTDMPWTDLTGLGSLAAARL